MPYQYRPRGMPARFLSDAPPIVRAQVLDVFAVTPAAPLDFDVMLREPVTHKTTGEVLEFVGLDFGQYGAQGCHFFLKPHEARAYRDRNRRKRVAWRDLPEPTQRAVLAYLASDTGDL